MFNKKSIKNYIICFFVLFLGLFTAFYNSKADDATVSVGSSGNADVGDGVSVSVSVSGGSISAYTVYLSYDPSVISFEGGSGGGAVVYGSDGTVTISGTGAGDVSLSFTAVDSGSSGLYTSGEFYDIDLNEIDVSYGSDSVSVSGATEAPTEAPTTEAPTTERTEAPTEERTEATTEDRRSSNCNLYTLEVTKGTLEPEFSASNTYYEMRVPTDTKEIEVSAYPADNKASVRVSDNDNIEPGENTMYVTVVAENGDTKTYTIRVIAGELLEDNVITVNGKKYNMITDYSDVDVDLPDGYDEITVKYEKWEIPAFSYKDGATYIVCLKDGQGNVSPFVYDKDKKKFYRYVLYYINNNRYLITDIDENAISGDKYHPVDLEIDGETVKAYKNDELDKDCYIVYAINLEGDSGFYLYDSVEGNLIRYTIITDSNVATPGDATGTDANTEPTTENNITTENSTEGTTTESVTTEAEIKKNTEKGFLSQKQFMWFLIIFGLIFLVLTILVIVFAIKYKSMLEDDEEDEDFVDELWKLDEDEAEGSAEAATTAEEDNDAEDTEDNAEVEEENDNTEESNAIEEKIDETIKETAIAKVGETQIEDANAEATSLEEDTTDKLTGVESEAENKLVLSSNMSELAVNNEILSKLKDVNKNEQTDSNKENVNEETTLDNVAEKSKVDNEEKSKSEKKKAKKNSKVEKVVVASPVDKSTSKETTTDSIDELNKKIDKLMAANNALWAEEKLKEDSMKANTTGDMIEDITKSEPKKKKSSFSLFDADQSIEDVVEIKQDSNEFEEAAKKIEEKLQDDYDADKDSAF